MDMVSTNGQMEVCIKEPGIKIKFLSTVNILGMTAGHTRDTGLTTICTGKVFIDGLTEESMKAITSTTKKKAMEFTPTLMAGLTKETGRTESNMVREYLSHHKAPRDKESGMKAKELNGWTRKNKNKKWKFNEEKNKNKNFGEIDF